MIETKDITNRIVQELELNDLPEEARNQIITKLGENILKRITITVLDKLPEDKRGEFETISKEGDVEKMQEFMRNNIANVDTLIEQEIRKNIEEFKEMKKQLASE